MTYDEKNGTSRDEGPSEELVALDERTARLLAAAAAPSRLPEALRARLLVLPQGAEAEEEGARRFERARAAGLEAAASGLPPALPAAASSSSARTERSLAHLIAETRRPAPLPAALRASLLKIGRSVKKPLPFWLVDPRWAAAACLVLALLSTFLVGDASALLGEHVAEVQERREEWQVIATEKMSATWEDAGSGLLRLWHRGQDKFSSRAQAVRDLCEEKLSQFNQTELARRLADERSKQGVSDGTQH